MKAVILAGGFGTRISEESHLRPKPMIEIGGKPILWHIMKIYSHYGINDFVICLGYKGYAIKDFFANYFLHTSDVTFDMQNNRMEVHQNYSEPWRVTLVETGEATMTGGRLKRVMPLLREDEAFCLTYGDGVGDIDLTAELAFHRQHGRIATVAAVPPPRRFGQLEMDGARVTTFSEKPLGEGGLINVGFFVLSPKVEEYLGDDSTIWEREPLMGLSRDGELMAFEHQGFWQPMDTIRERQELDELWSTGKAPWKTWA